MVSAASFSDKRPAAGIARAFGRYELRQLLGKSQHSMVWLALDPRTAQEVMLTLPRVQPADAAAVALWQREAGMGARLNHPHLAHVVELGVQNQWPYVAVDRALGITLGEWLVAHPSPSPLDTVGWLCQALEGLAFAHDAGVVHGDLQPHHMIVNEHGTVRVMALAVITQAAGPAPGEQALRIDTERLQSQRGLAERDVLAAGLVLHRLLAGENPLDEADLSLVAARMAAPGREPVRLPWNTPHPVPEALRAIANRATTQQERQRYLNARTLLRALEGWRESEGQGGESPLSLLLDRLRTVGHLPALPGVSMRVAQLLALEGQRTDEIAEQILQDMALTFEVLRMVNSAQVQGTQTSGSGPVLTVRRAVALVGLNGIRQCGAGLRAWPGPLSEAGANELQRVMNHARLAGRVAQVLCPAGYDPEVVYLVAVLQNLGRLLVQYHFVEEAQQIRQLMRPVPPPADAPPGTPEQPGMSEAVASFGVLGVDIEVLGAAVAKQWGLGEEVQHMMRPFARNRPVRSPDGDLDMLRAAASAANEALDAASLLPATKVATGLAGVAQRYARVLSIELRDLQAALQQGREALRRGTSVSPRQLDAASAAPSSEDASSASPPSSNLSSPSGSPERKRTR
jgi:HD-like signal output (HDOD) protein